jgi:hypothetical protein
VLSPGVLARVSVFAQRAGRVWPGDDVAKVLLVSERQVVATILWNWVQAAPPIRGLCDLASAR